MLKDFKEFAMRGSVVDMAVGIIIGGAFGKIVSSFVTDVLLPPIGLMMGGVDFTMLQFVLKEASDTAEAVTLNYGLFISSVIDFTIIAFAIFMVIKQMNRMKKPEAEPTTKECPKCCSTIPLKATRCSNCTSEVS